MAAAKIGADSARRAIDLLFAFEHAPVASVRQLADAVGMPSPTTHRYIAMLRELGLVEESTRGQYRLTMRVAALGRAAKGATSLIDVIQPFMRSLAEQTNETILFVQPIANLMVCAQRIETQRYLRLSFEVGQPLPALRGASAHLRAGSLPESDRRGYVDDALARGEQSPRSGIEGFLEEARRDAERGWSVSQHEIDDGVWSAAAPLHSEGRFIGTLSVPCPSSRINDERAEEIVAAVRSTAAEIDAVLGD